MSRRWRPPRCARRRRCRRPARRRAASSSCRSGPTLAAHWLMPRLGPFLRAHDHIQLEIITHPYPASVRRREADVVLRPVDSGEENLIGRKMGRLGTGFYASRDYAARRRLPERRDEWKDHSVIGFADRAVERAAGALERCDHAAGVDGDALLVAGRHARRRRARASAFRRCPALSRPPIRISSASRPQKLASVADLLAARASRSGRTPGGARGDRFRHGFRARGPGTAAGVSLVRPARLALLQHAIVSSTTDAPPRRAAGATARPAAPSAWRSGASAGRGRP